MKAKGSKDALFDPRSCTYKLNGKIREHVERLMNLDSVEPATKSVLVELMDEDEANKNTLTYDSLVKLHKYIQRADEEYTDPFYLFVAESCKCIEPKPRENQQLDARLKLLRLRQSHHAYDNMAASVDRAVEEKLEKLACSNDKINLTSKVYSNPNSNNNTDSESTLSEFKNLYGSVVAVFNSFLVFICTFIFCYKALEYALPRPHITAQVLFGLGGSTIVAIAELYFLIRVV